MWLYSKRLQYPVNIKHKDLKMAKMLLAQYGGPDGELGAALRYLNQRYTMPDEKGKALLTDIGTEELAHMEIIASMIYQLLHGASLKQLEENGLLSQYTQHDHAPFPTDTNGVPFSASYIETTGDPLSDLSSDMAAEERARSAYERLMNETNDPDLLAPLAFLRQREIVHYARFSELYNEYKQRGL